MAPEATRNLVMFSARLGGVCVISLGLIALAPVAYGASLSMVGSAADAIEFRQLQQPFALRQLPAKSGGKLSVDLQPASASIDSNELLARLSTGKLDFVALSAAQWRGIDGAVELAELAGIAFDLPRARTLADGMRPGLERTLSSKHGLKLLAFTSAQAQVLYCRFAFKSIAEIKGRRVRVDGAMLQGLMQALGATAVPMNVDAVAAGLRADAIDCAVGGTMQGNEARWYEHSSHLYSLPLAWTLNLYLADERNWSRLEGTNRQVLLSEFRALEQRTWESNAIYTREGINCNAGVEPCKGGARGKMNIVIGSDADRALLLRLSNDTVLPQWSQRCGTGCAELLRLIR